MTGGASDRATAVFLALSRVPPADRPGVLDAECAGDPALRAEVDRLLASLDLPDTALSALDGRALPSAGPDNPSQPSGAVIGGFVVMRQIGAGAAGVVHLARQQHPARIVALKVLRREFVASAVQRRFEIEAELLAELHHPGIAQIYAAHPGSAHVPPFIAMEFVDGPSLTDYADLRRLSAREKVELVAHICDAVQHAHQRGIIHRDLKPGNILVTGDGQPKVLDFGVARRLAKSAGETLATESGQLLGTLAYMSPEQVRAVPEDIDTRTDIHALGVILFRLLAGRLPFGHDDPSLPELARRIEHDDPPRLGTIDTAFRGDLDVIVARALAKEKERRYPSAASLASDLRRYLAGQPIAASADSAWYVVRRQIGRYRLALGFSAVALVAVSALASYAVVQRGRADRTNVQLEHQLATSTIERGRLLGITGNHPVAEELVWREYFRNPASLHARWALWEIYAREPILWTRTVHPAGTQTLRFTPDGRTLVTAGRLDATLQILDANTGAQVRTVSWQPQSIPRRLHVTSGTPRIVLATEDGSIRIWNLESGRLERELIAAVPRLYDLALAADGSTAVAVASGRVELWSLSEGTRVSALPLPPRAFAAAIDPAGRFVAIIGQDGTVTSLGLPSGQERWKRRGHPVTGLSIAIDPAGTRIASGDVEGVIQIWNAATGAPERTIETFNGRMRSLVFDETGTQLAVAGVWRTEVWDLAVATAAPRVFGASEGATDLHLRAGLTRVATCNGGSGQVRMWNAVADPIVAVWPAHTGTVTGIAAQDADRVISVGSDAVRAARQVGRREPLTTFKGQGSVSGFDLSRNGRWIVTSGTAGQAAVWDARDGRRLASLPEARSSRTAVFAADDRLIAVGQTDGTVRLWDWTDELGAHRLRSLPVGGGEVMALDGDRTRLVVAANRAVIVVDTSTEQEVRRFTSTSSPYSAALTPDGRFVAVGTFLGAVDVFELATGALVASLKGQTALVPGLDFSADGRLLAVASRDGSTRLWDFPASQLLATVGIRRPGASRVKFLPGDLRLAVGYDDGLLEIRDLGYFSRYVAGNAEYQFQKFTAAGERFARGEDVLDWARRVLGGR